MIHCNFGEVFNLDFTRLQCKVRFVKYNSKIYLKLIVKDNNCHNKYNSIIAAFIYDFESHSKYYYNFSHGDVIADTTFELFKKEIESGNYIVYVNNKKTYKINK